ncbi:TolB family protein [Roseivirga sp.]|uniref:TolB family protein n=1 Tax=Roseivirga sp. TaxID=1964215 RepID=UPI003B524F2E
MKKLFSLLFISSLTGSLLAQTAPPSTDIHVYELKEKKGKVTLSKGRNITDRAGYDNQPSFFNNDYILYTSSQESGQTDIMIYDLYEDKVKNLTGSRDSEYSPTPIPGFNSFAVVRVEADNSQRLWMYHMDGKGAPQLIFDKIQPVGYFAINEKDVLMFVLGEPVTMVLANMEEVDDDIITSNIGRTIRTIPGTKDFTFERREDNGSWFIYTLNKTTKEFTKVVEKPEGASDWTITGEGTYITSVGSKLLAFNPKHHSEWQEIEDLGAVGAKGITRMAVSQENDKLALVINN